MVDNSSHTKLANKKPLKRLRRLSDADKLAHLQSLLKRGEPGKDGKTPSVQELLSLIQPLIPEPVHGKDGHTPTEAELLELIEPLIPEPVHGKDGKDGKTPSVQELLSLIQPLMPEPIRVNYNKIIYALKSEVKKQVEDERTALISVVTGLKDYVLNAIEAQEEKIRQSLVITSEDGSVLVKRTGRGNENVDLSVDAKFRETDRGIEIRIRGKNGKFGPWRLLRPNEREAFKTRPLLGGGGAGWSTAGRGGDTFTSENLTVAMDGQTNFTLTKTPIKPQTSFLVINTAIYSFPDYYIFSGSSLVWTDLFILETDDCLQVHYQV